MFRLALATFAVASFAVLFGCDQQAKTKTEPKAQPVPVSQAKAPDPEPKPIAKQPAPEPKPKAEPKQVDPEPKAKPTEPEKVALKFLRAFPEKYAGKQIKTDGFARRVETDKDNKRVIILLDKAEFTVENVLKSVGVRFDEDIPDSLMGERLEVIGTFGMDKLSPTAKKDVPFLKNAKLVVP